jgi:hypothetical protein
VAPPSLNFPCGRFVAYPGHSVLLRGNQNQIKSKDNDHRSGKRYIIKDFTVATWNVRGIIHKVDELNREFQNRTTGIAVISETKKKKEYRIKRIR